MIKNSNTSRGLIRTIVLIVIALLILSFLGFNLREIADSPTTKDNFSYVTTFVLKVWNDYLKAPVAYVWREVFINLIWEPITSFRDTGTVNDGSLTASSTPRLPNPPEVR